ncbi:MAG: PD40 domain-containing protein [Anaerolineaceae bacterium]|nr:PD40 domain-containing protein [Anaerolineaceae bacterium]
MFRIIARITGITILALAGAGLLALGVGQVFKPSRFTLAFDQFEPGVGRTVVYADPLYGLTRTLGRGETTERAVDTPVPVSASADVTVRAFPVNGNVELFLVWPDGRRQQLTVPDSFADAHHNTAPVWSPDGSWIAFISSHGQADMDVYVIRPDGSGLQRIAQDVGSLMPLRLRWVNPAG